MPTEQLHLRKSRIFVKRLLLGVLLCHHTTAEEFKPAAIQFFSLNYLTINLKATPANS